MDEEVVTNEKIVDELLGVVGEAKRWGELLIANVAFAAALQIELREHVASVYVEASDREDSYVCNVFYDLVHIKTEKHDECIPTPLLSRAYAVAAYRAAADGGGFVERRHHSRRHAGGAPDAVRDGLLARIRAWLAEYYIDDGWDGEGIPPINPCIEWDEIKYVLDPEHFYNWGKVEEVADAVQWDG